MKCRNLKAYKYELLEDEKFVCAIPKEISTGYANIHNYIITAITRYAWNGITGWPKWLKEPKCSRRATLIHDAIYQMIKEGLLGMYWRKTADLIFKRICIEDGMWKWTAWLFYYIVRLFGGVLIRLKRIQKNK